jgi:hypothetical protein
VFAMDKNYFVSALQSIKTTKEVFEQMEKESNSIKNYLELFGLPHEHNSYQIVHKLRIKIMAAISYHYGVRHLNNQKYPYLALKELDIAQEIAGALLSFDYKKYVEMYNTLTKEY